MILWLSVYAGQLSLEKAPAVLDRVRPGKPDREAR